LEEIAKDGSSKKLKRSATQALEGSYFHLRATTSEPRNEISGNLRETKPRQIEKFHKEIFSSFFINKGNTIIITLQNGTKYDGVLDSIKDDLSMGLKHARKYGKDQKHIPYLNILGKDIISMELMEEKGTKILTLVNFKQIQPYPISQPQGRIEN
jgi:small nuclear ribonucleoprotein (snRNP)-like protein